MLYASMLYSEFVRKYKKKTVWKISESLTAYCSKLVKGRESLKPVAGFSWDLQLFSRQL